MHKSYVHVGSQGSWTMPGKLTQLNEKRHTHTHVNDIPLIYHMWRHAETISSGLSAAMF